MSKPKDRKQKTNRLLDSTQASSPGIPFSTKMETVSVEVYFFSRAWCDDE